MWLFDSIAQAWHLWVGKPADGDPAWCGRPKDGDCDAKGGTDVNRKCRSCVTNYAASLKDDS